MADWFDQGVQSAPAAPSTPQAPGVIYGRPKPGADIKLQRDAVGLQRDQQQIQNDNVRLNLQLQDQVLQQQKAARDAEEAARKRNETQARGGVDSTEAERTAAFLATRVAGGLTALQQIGSGGDPTLSTEAAGMFGKLGNFATPEARQRAIAAQNDLLDAALTLGTGAAYTAEQINNYRNSYFPQVGDKEQTIADKRQRLKLALEAARVKAGAAAPQIDAALRAAGFVDPPSSGIQMEGQFGDAQTPPQTPRYTPEQEKQIAALAPRAQSPQDLIDLTQTFGIPITPESAQAAFDYYKKGGKQAPVVDYGPADEAYQQQLRDRAASAERVQGTPGADDLVMQGAMGQLGDEAAGVGAAIGGLLRGNPDLDLNYRLGRDTERTRLEQARKNAGAFAFPAEILGGFASIGPGANALMPSSAAQAFRQGAVPGAVVGGVTGFGSGEGLQGSTTNALLGAGLGGTIGGGLSAGGYAAAPALGRMQRPAQDLGFTVDNAPATAADVAAAGQAEGVTVSRAMVDPASRNRVTGAETTMAGGPIIQRGMKETSRQIEGRTAQLGQGGTAMEPNVAGQTVEGAGKRFIEKSGKNIGQMYDRAVSLSQGVKVKPNEANQVLDDAIGRLSQTSNTNSAEIAYLQGLKQDLSKPLGVEALRDLRTTLRQKISKGDLVFGQNESRVLGVMDALSSDIRNGLNAAGRKDAANAFDQADGLYRQRMEFIQGTVQKLIGKRDANLPPERVFSNLQAMASPKGDEAGLAKMMRTMTPEEQSDIAATFADALGKNNNGEFTTAQFVAQAEKLPDAARRHLFGDRGAESVKNLITLSKAHKAVPFNSSRTGVANDYRSWVANLFLGGGAGVATQSGTTGIAAAAAGVAAKTGKDILTARALMSPKITKWIVNAPKTSSPQAINQHFQRLGTIAAQEPALSGEIQVIQQRIMEAAKGGMSAPAPANDVGQSGQRPEQ